MMGMTIDEKINCLKSGVIEGYDCTKCPYVNKPGCDFNGTIKWALGVIEKYQKITEIVKSWRENGLDYDSCDAMENIERVVEDGNDD